MALYFIERGNYSADSIVFVHGGVGLSSWMWDKQLEYFKEYHCIVPDLPEHGKSVMRGRLSIQGCADQIAEIIEKKANRGKAHIIGYSFGAKIILELLNSRPELVSSAIVASALLRPVPVMRFSNSLGAFRLITHILKYKAIRGMLLRFLDFPDESYRINCLIELQGLTANKLYRIFSDYCHNLELPQRVREIEVPTLVIAGEKESVAMKRSVVDMVNTIPAAKGILLKNAHHTYPWSMHRTFNDIVGEWISGKPITDKGVIHL